MARHLAAKESSASEKDKNLVYTEGPALNSIENNQNQEIGSTSFTMSRFGLFLLLLLVVALADLITKSVVFDRHYSLNRWGNEPNWWIEGVLGIQTSTNPGALFGLGAGYSWLFAILSIIVFAIIVSWLFFFGGARDRWLTIAFGLVSGGIIGNLYDRVGLGFVPGRPMEIQYHVRDWIHFRLQGVPFFDPWPNFNLADAGLVVGAMLLLLHAFIVPVEGKQNESGLKRQVVPSQEL